MGKNRHPGEELVSKIRHMDVLTAQGRAVVMT